MPQSPELLDGSVTVLEEVGGPAAQFAYGVTRMIVEPGEGFAAAAIDGEDCLGVAGQ